MAVVVAVVVAAAAAVVSRLIEFLSNLENSFILSQAVSCSIWKYEIIFSFLKRTRFPLTKNFLVAYGSRHVIFIWGLTYFTIHKIWPLISVTRKKSPNVYKSCPKSNKSPNLVTLPLIKHFGKNKLNKSR